MVEWLHHRFPDDPVPFIVISGGDPTAIQAKAQSLGAFGYLPKPVDKQKLLDRFVTMIVGGEMSAKTRETLLKQLSDQVTLPSMPPAQTASTKAPPNPFETAFQRGILNPGGGGGGPQQQQLASVSPATAVGSANGKSTIASTKRRPGNW